MEEEKDTVVNTEDLWDADPDCEHEIINLWSGIRCKKCKGWFCY